MKVGFERPPKNAKFKSSSALRFMAEMLAHELERISDLSYKEAFQITLFWVQGTKVPDRPVKVTVPDLWKQRR